MNNDRVTSTPVRPNSADFWSHYLNYVDYTQPIVWDTVAGSIGETYGPPNANSCATRVSYGLNYGGHEIQTFAAASVNLRDHNYKGKAGDGKRYIVSAAQMAAYLKLKWGAPDHNITSTAQLATVISSLGSKCAIFATPSPPGGHGHAGTLKNSYTDPYVTSELPVDVWILG